MDNYFLFEKLNELNFYDGVNDILPILNENLDRVVFVKSHRGLKNVLFLSELNAKSFDSPFFLKLVNDTKNNPAILSSGLAYNLDIVLNRLKEFFRNTNCTLYVEIGFVSYHPNQDTMVKIYQAIVSENNKRDFKDIVADFAVYPDWYDACPHAKTIINTENNLKEFEKIGKELHIQAINDYTRKIDEALMNDDIESFKLYSEKLMKLKE